MYRKGQGYLYIGTREGLIIYDGLNFENVTRAKNTSSWITHLYDDGKHFWVGFHDGAICTLKGKELIPWEIEEGWPGAPITSIIKGTDEVLWISTYGEGLYGYYNERLFNINTDDGLKSNDIYDMVIDEESHVYIATDFGVFMCSFEDQKKIIQPLHGDNSLNREVIYQMRYNSVRNSILCLAHSGIVYEINVTDYETRVISEPNLNIDLIENRSGQLWALSSDSQEICMISADSVPIQKANIAGLEEKPEITHMMYDNENILWLICKNNGLISADGRFKLFSNGIPDAQAIIRIEDIIFCGNDQGLFRLYPDQKPEVLINKINVLTLFHEKSRNELWIGTFGHGIFIYNINSGRVSHYDEGDGLINNNVFSIVQFLDDIWISGLAGIQRWTTDKNIVSFWNKATGLSSDYNYVLFPDNQGRLWVGSDGAGINYFDKDLQIFKIGKDETITSFAEDGAGNIWYCAVDTGTGYIKNHKMIPFDTRKGLTESHISGVMSDFEGQILVFHHTGIDQINYQSHMVKVLGDHIGVRKWNQNINAFHKYLPPFIYLTHHDDWIEFTPQENNAFSPLLVIKNAFCGNSQLEDSSLHNLKHYDNDFVIEYSGIHFANPNHVQYRYKLIPLDNDWRYTKDKKLYYKNLSPGTYHFSIQSGHNITFDPSKTVQYSFTIRKPFWNTIPFFILVLTVLSISIYYYVHSKSRKDKYIKQIQTDQIKNQLDILKSQINPHFLFNSFNTLISTIERDPHKAVIFVEKLSDFYRNILLYRDQDTIDLEEEMNILQDYIFLLHQRFKDNISIVIDLKDVPKTKVIPMTLQLLLENAVKHNIISTRYPLKIRIYVEGHYIVMNNRLHLKKNKEKSTQFGLHSLKKRYENLCRRTIIVEETDDYFTVKIPFIEA